jgi:hypothetical protein
MLKEIESGVLDLLDKGGLQTREITIEQAIDSPIHPARPACHVRITGVSPKRITQVVRRYYVSVAVIIIVKSDKSEKDRRHLAYPLIEAVQEYLSGKAPITGINFLECKTVKEITSGDDIDNGLSKWQIDFDTSYEIRMAEDAGAIMLRTVLADFGRPDVATDELTAQVTL